MENSFANKLTELIAFLRRQLLSLDVAENVDPEKRREAHIDNSQLRRNKKKVDSLSGKPEETRTEKRRQELLLALVERSILHLHYRHSGEENYQQGGRQNELIEKQFPHNYPLGRSRKSSVEPLVPVV